MGKLELTPRYAGSRIKNDTQEVPKDQYESGRLALLVMAFGATLFGGIHIGAWNFEFPSQAELIFWRCASVFSAAYGITFIIISSVPKISVIFMSMWTLYIMARLFLLVEIFRTLCFLPPDAYISTWTTNIPHVI